MLDFVSVGLAFISFVSLVAEGAIRYSGRNNALCCEFDGESIWAARLGDALLFRFITLKQLTVVRLKQIFESSRNVIRWIPSAALNVANTLFCQSHELADLHLSETLAFSARH